MSPTISRRSRDTMPPDSLDTLIGENVLAAFEVDGPEAGRWTISRATVNERMSSSYAIVAELVEHAPAADPTALLGATCRIRVSRRGCPVRRYPGIIEQVTTGSEASGRLSRTRCTVRMVPALELLHHGRSTRVFQNARVPEIVEDVLSGGLGAYEREVQMDLLEEYPRHEYRTQYDESDLAFVQRLMGEAGLFAFFDTSGSKEKLLVVDDASKYPALVGAGSAVASPDILRFTAADAGGNEAIRSFVRVDRTRPTTVRLRHFDWPRPGNFAEAHVEAVADDPAIGAVRGPSREVYEHDTLPLSFHAFDEDLGQYRENDSRRQVALRRHQHVQDALTFEGESNAIGLAVGTAFELAGHPRPELDGAYVVVAITHAIHVGDTEPSETRVAGLEATYSNHFRCVRADIPYRASRQDKPHVRGILSATIVGLGSEEIHTDAYGRVKVQFHFDRQGQNDDKSSCFLRVMQPWAGPGWGFVFLPRVGMEAVVSFLDGDPDRPVVIGTMYNGDNHPPYDLPLESTRSGIRTQTTPDGGGYNELSFEDAKGSEEIHLHAQRDLREVVKASHSLSVGGKQTVAVSSGRSVTIEKGDTEEVKASDKKAIVGGEYNIVVEKHFRVTRDETEIIVEEAIRGTSPSTIELNVGDNKISISDDGSVKVAGDSKVELKVGDNQVSVTDDGKVKVSAATQIELICGSASLVLKQDGTLEVTGSKKVGLSSGESTFELEPSKSTSHSAQVDVSGDSAVNITGGQVNFNA
jgi:type VI secretion system secreted protein VgrG